MRLHGLSLGVMELLFFVVVGVFCWPLSKVWLELLACGVSGVIVGPCGVFVSVVGPGELFFGRLIIGCLVPVFPRAVMYLILPSLDTLV